MPPRTLLPLICRRLSPHLQPPRLANPNPVHQPSCPPLPLSTPSYRLSSSSVFFPPVASHSGPTKIQTPQSQSPLLPSQPQESWLLTPSGGPQLQQALPGVAPVPGQLPNESLDELLDEFPDESYKKSHDELADELVDHRGIPPPLPHSHLNPAPDDFRASSFEDKAILELRGGQGGSGSVSFFRDAFVPAGPANGGDGGPGGSVYIQAVAAETSLHKLARRRVIPAGPGEHGRGANRPGGRGRDVVISVPVGTIVTELARDDPYASYFEHGRAESSFRTAMDQFRTLNGIKKRRRRLPFDRPKATAADEPGEGEIQEGEDGEEDVDEEEPYEEGYEGEELRKEWIKKHEEDKAAAEAEEGKIEPDPEPDMLSREHHSSWILFPGLTRAQARSTLLPRYPPPIIRPAHQPRAPVKLDLSYPTAEPILLAAGAAGGLGNPHFATTDAPRPMMATRGAAGVSLTIQLELKLLADVGLVGLPNAGKSTVLRALSNARARVGHWAFTTLRPNVGTVVLDRNRGRPHHRQPLRRRRPRFTVADIPGLIEDAHLNRGLGIEFLRHVERASVLAFVLDLAVSAPSPADTVRVLWRELGQYSRQCAAAQRLARTSGRVDWDWQPPPPSLFSPSLASAASTASSSPLSLDDYVDQRMAHPDDMTHRNGDNDADADDDDALAITAKPWFVIANKSELPASQKNFAALESYLADIASAREPHPSGLRPLWGVGDSPVHPVVIPISAIHGHGMDRVIDWMVRLLDEPTASSRQPV